MSISPNVGAIPRYLNKMRLSPPMQFIKDNFEEQVKQIPFVGDSISPELERIKEGMKRLAVPQGRGRYLKNSVLPTWDLLTVIIWKI